MYALSPYAVFNDRMAMLDGPLATWGALALFFTLRVSRKPDGPSSLPNLVGLGLAIGAAWLTKFFAAWLVLLPLLLATLASGASRATRLRLALLPISLSLGILVPFLLAPNGGNLVADVHEHGTTHALVPTLLGQFGAVGGWALLYLTPPGLALCLLGATLSGQRGWRLVAVWLGLSAVTYACIPTTFAASRYLFLLVVPAVLLIAPGADHVLRRAPSRPAAALLALALVPALM